MNDPSKNLLAELLKESRENEFLRKGNASKKCKFCFGRGHIEFAEPNSTAQIYLCECVVKKIKKEIKET